MDKIEISDDLKAMLIATGDGSAVVLADKINEIVDWINSKRDQLL